MADRRSDRSVIANAYEASARNLVTLPMNHPAFLPSLENIEKLANDMRRQYDEFHYGLDVT